jgi:hypothetical protein
MVVGSSFSQTGGNDAPTIKMDELNQLSELIRARNDNARRITELVGRPAQIGHLGEFIASKIFDICLETSAVAKGFDGRFQSGGLTGNSVNVKWYAKRESLLDIREDTVPDFYLVLAGPVARMFHSRGEVRPWQIDSVHLFSASSLVETLRLTQLKIGIATSIKNALWDEAELFPRQRCTLLQINEQQADLLRLFSSPKSI